MAFRRRNVVVAQSQAGSQGQTASATGKETLEPGTRPSPLDGRLTTSTGTRSLDSLLAGHAGLALGTSLLVEESGTTDFAGSLLRYYAAEGVVQGHIIHVLGMNEQWGRELPGLSNGDSSSKTEERKVSEDKMKIAWRYERLGEFGAGARGVWSFLYIMENKNQAHAYHSKQTAYSRKKRTRLLRRPLSSTMNLT
jgi:elongator complex protein 4